VELGLKRAHSYRERIRATVLGMNSKHDHHEQIPTPREAQEVVEAKREADDGY
jgi:hypothetical protein